MRPSSVPKDSQIWLASAGLEPPVKTFSSSETDPEETLLRILPEIKDSAELLSVDAGFIAPRFEQLHLPALLENLKVDLYFNPGFTIPAIKTTRFQASVVHDVVFLDHPEWVEPRLRKYLTHGTDLALRRADLVLTDSEYSRSRIRALADQRDWDRAGRVELLRPAVAEA